MLDILYTLRSIDGTTIDTSPKCSWQDLPGSVKVDNDGKEVQLSTNYISLLQKLQTGSPAVIDALHSLAKTTDEAGHANAATDARVARGWLKRLAERDWTTTTWDADFSRLTGFWTCLNDARTGFDTALHGASSRGQMRVLEDYVHDLARLEPEAEKIEWARSTLSQKVIRRLSGTLAALRIGEVVKDDDDDDGFWQEESIGSSVR